MSIRQNKLRTHLIATTFTFAVVFAINIKKKFICRESVGDLKRYNVKRHYDLKHKKCFDGAYVGKDERMKEFKK